MKEERIKNYIKKFRKLDGTKIENVSEYIKKYIKKHKNETFEIFIGTDSQKVRKRKLTWYASVICIYRKGKGAHIIYAKEKRNDIIGIEKRLIEEVDYSINIALYLRDNNALVLNRLTSLHLDLSPEVQNESNKVYKTAVGWVRGLGFDWRTKPDACAASYAADMCVRREN